MGEVSCKTAAGGVQTALLDFIVRKISCRALQLTLLRISVLFNFTVCVLASEAFDDVISVLLAK